MNESLSKEATFYELISLPVLKNMLTNKSHLHLGGVMFCKFKIHFTRDQDNL